MQAVGATAPVKQPNQFFVSKYDSGVFHLFWYQTWHCRLVSNLELPSSPPAEVEKYPGTQGRQEEDEAPEGKFT